MNGTQRSHIIVKNILISFIIKASQALIVMLLVREVLLSLNSNKYGVWATILTIITWCNMLDFGLGNGFRNQVAIAISQGQWTKAQRFVSTAYSVMIAISVFLFISFYLINNLINWHNIFNINFDFDENLSFIMLIAFSFFSVQLVLRIILSLLLAIQKTALSNFLTFLGQLVALLGIILAEKFLELDLQLVILFYLGSPVIVYLSATYILFKKKELYSYRPTKFEIDKLCLQNMLGLGVKFFILQITTIIMFTSGNFVIMHTLGIDSVATYDVAYRFYLIVISVFTTLMTPFWSAFTEAFSTNDFWWIKSTLKKLRIICLFFIISVFLLLYVSDYIFTFWLDEEVFVPFNLRLVFSVYVALINWTSIYSYFLNGIGKINAQLILAIFQLVINIPLAVFLINICDMGVSGFIVATCISLSLSAIVLPIQSHRILNDELKNYKSN